MSDFGLKLKEIRKAKGFSQVTLAKALKVSRSAVSMWEMGEREPEIDMIIEAAKVLGVQFTELIGAELIDDGDEDILVSLSLLKDYAKPTEEVEMLNELIKAAGYEVVRLEGETDYKVVFPSGGFCTVDEEKIATIIREISETAVLHMKLIEREEWKEIAKIMSNKKDE